ncbi:hypothetical protein [Erythrobacter sp. F6033]|uniref:lipopolysaccharide biosynthesis protein n=1 Tax=Erythrobacter sp. F6033 TaxID=2926401 RepID=UPI001FF3496C|nr:hypothetical protein [Erythrobacter sp. F6033]MCK0127190.1 hypothetical protein [Erythrobacter sp. F6033]
MTGQGTPRNPNTGFAAKLSAFFGGTVSQRRSLFGALAVRGAGVLAGFAVTYLIGNNFGAAATGRYALATQTAMLLATAGLLGLDVSIVRHASRTASDNKPLALSFMLRFLSLGFGMIFLLTLVFAVGASSNWKFFFGDVLTADFLLVLCLLLIGRGGGQLLGGLLRSQHQFTLGLAVATVFVPAASAVALATGLADSIKTALWAAAIGGLMSVGTGLALLRMNVSRAANATSVPMRSIITSALPLWGAGLALAMSEWYGLAVAARVLSAADAGLYRVSFQLSGILLMMSATIWSVYSTQISAAFHADDTKEVARLARSSVKAGAVVAVPMTILILFGGEFILAQIGPEFVAAQRVISIMVVANLLAVLIGPYGIVLAMSGNERANLALSIVATGLLLIAAPLSALYGGLIGLTICIAVALVGRYVAAFCLVRWRLGIGLGVAKA